MRHSGQADELDGARGGDGHLQRLRVGVADVLAGEDDHAPGDELGVLAAGEHGGHVVDGGVGVAAAHRLDEGRDGVVVRILAVVGHGRLLGRVAQVVDARGVTASPALARERQAVSSALRATRASPREISARKASAAVGRA